MSVHATADKRVEITIQLDPKSAAALKARHGDKVALDDAVVAAISEYSKRDGFVQVSELALLELASVLGSERIGSEEQLIDQVRKSLGARRGTVTFEVDSTLLPYMMDVATSNKIPLSQVVKNYLDLGVQNGWWNEYIDVRGYFFNPRQHARLKAAMSPAPVTAEFIIHAIEELRQKVEAEKLAAAEAAASSVPALPAGATL